MQTAGFTPSKVAEKNAEAFTMRNREAELSARWSVLVRNWVMAETNGDKDGQVDIENQIKRWNSKHHDARISRPGLVRRSRFEARKAGKPLEPSRRYRKDVEAGYLQYGRMIRWRRGTGAFSSMPQRFTRNGTTHRMQFYLNCISWADLS
ncbi:hypothetical protein [Laribacter hongkongensis]|uniref:hypothetical protein n=1 Tax=Laribacter hongkongensis TaxID=168471 RepID=UPI001EFC497C|nr:hypothetical protein [Laribacter hongkongensis]MCG9032470.1 hypothetical protein [Laribacter hongkongensis]